MILTLLAAAAALAVIASPASAQGGGASKADGALDRAMANLVDRSDGPPGAISIVQRGDDVAVHRAGVAQIDGGVPGRRMRMRIASTAKAMSGFVALTLVEEGTLSLDDTIGKWLPSQPLAWHDVTLAELLQHTSGVPDFTGSEGFRNAVGASPLHAPPPPTLVSYVANKPLNFTPGTEYRYSNSDNVLVGLMVQAATGRSYPSELKRVLTKPVGLGRTYLRPATSVPTPVIHGYVMTNDGYEDVTNEVDFGGWAWASGGVVSTPANLNRFARAYVPGPAMIDSASFVPGNSEPQGPGTNSAGLAIFRYETKCGTVYGHTGSILGYTQFLAASADGTRSVTFAINAQYSDSLLPALRKAEEKAVCAALA